MATDKVRYRGHIAVAREPDDFGLLAHQSAFWAPFQESRSAAQRRYSHVTVGGSQFIYSEGRRFLSAYK